MTDLPQHAATVSLLSNLHNPDFRFADLFWVNWFTPYLFSDVLCFGLTPLLGIVATCKFLTSVALMAVPLCTALLMQESGSDPFWAVLTIAALYGFTYSWGLLNYLVATPIGLLFLVFAMRHGKKPTPGSSIVLAVFAVFLFFCHALICALFLAVAGFYTLAQAGNLRQAIARISPMLAAIPIMLAWYLRASKELASQQATTWDLGWFTSVYPEYFGGRVSGFPARLLGLHLPSPVCILIVISLFSIPLLAGERPCKRLTAWIPLALCVGILLFAPSSMLWVWAISHRFTIFALPFFLMALRPAEVKRPAWRIAAVLLVAGWVAVITVQTVRFDAEASGFKQVLAKMEPNERALSLIFTPWTGGFISPVFLHFPAWYSASKMGVVDVNFTLWPTELVRYQPAAAPPVRLGWEWYPDKFNWRRWGGSAYRYFVVRAPTDEGYQLFRGVPCSISLEAHAGDWWLYESYCFSRSQP
jgi:hypothetical protein